jgi:hypothetical protein
VKTKLKSTSDICVGVGILLSMLLSFAALETKATGIDNVYWVSTNTDSDNLGTLDNPFICNTQTSFDYRMNNLPANSTIHILAGTYQTLGDNDWFIKSGQKILGSGIDVTIIQLVTNAPSGSFVMGSPPGTNIVVSDLTIAGANTSTLSYSGLCLSGTKLTVSRVKAINLAFFDKSVNSEAWGIGMVSCGYGSTIQSEGNIIEDCEVSHFQGGSGISAIFFNGSPTNSISGIMRGNRVYLSTSVPLGYFAFNGAWTHNWLVEDNYVHGGSVGFYGDTGSYLNVVVAHNLFENCYYGIELLYGNRKNLTFASNTILLNPGTNVYNHNDAFLFYIASGFTYTNIVISGNSVDFSGATICGMTYNFLNADTVGGLTVKNNTVDSLLVNHISDCNAINIQKNFDLNGNILTNFDPYISDN